MPPPLSTVEFLELVRKSGVVEAEHLDTALANLRANGSLADEVKGLAE